MFLSWRGKGLWVFFIFLFWLLAIPLVAIFLQTGPETDHFKLAVAMDLGVALIFALSALNVFLLERYSRSHPQKMIDATSKQVFYVQNIDEFMWLPMKIWPPILLGFAVVFVIFAYFGYDFTG